MQHNIHQTKSNAVISHCKPSTIIINLLKIHYIFDGIYLNSFNTKKSYKLKFIRLFCSFAERTRFELVVGLLLRQFSKLVVSATHPSLQYFRTLTLQIRTFKILSQSTMRFSQKHCKVSALIGIYQMFLLFFITQKYHFSTTMTKHVDYQSNLHIAFFIIL